METILVAKALLIDKKGDCLVLRRSKTHPTMALDPDLPGGKLAEDESPLAAVCREITEEVGLDLDDSKVHLQYAATDASWGKNFIRFIFVTHLDAVQPDITISWEHDSFEWMPLEKLRDYLEHPEYQKAVAHIIEHKLK